MKGEENDGIPPGKYANAELMKIPNFLHLTPSHVTKHCAALKRKLTFVCCKTVESDLYLLFEYRFDANYHENVENRILQKVFMFV